MRFSHNPGAQQNHVWGFLILQTFRPPLQGGVGRGNIVVFKSCLGDSDGQIELRTTHLLDNDNDYLWVLTVYGELQCMLHICNLIYNLPSSHNNFNVVIMISFH